MLAFDRSVKDRFCIALWLPKSITRAESISRPLRGLNCRSISILQTAKKLNTIETSVIPASILTRVASSRTCIAAVCGRCASTLVTRVPKNRTRVTSISSRKARQVCRSRSICRRKLVWIPTIRSPLEKLAKSASPSIRSKTCCACSMAFRSPKFRLR